LARWGGGDRDEELEQLIPFRRTNHAVVDYAHHQLVELAHRPDIGELEVRPHPVDRRYGLVFLDHTVVHPSSSHPVKGLDRLLL